MIIPQNTTIHLNKRRIRKGLILAACMCMTSLHVFSRDPVNDSTGMAFPNAAKLNLASAFFNKVSLAYERQINDKWSVLAGGGYRFGGKIPELAGFSVLQMKSSSRGMKGYTFSAATRYRIRPCDCKGPAGFYAGAYVTSTYLWGDLVVAYSSGEQLIDVAGEASLREVGIGLQLGYQFVFWDRLIVDLMFMGPRRSYHRLNLSLESQYAAEVIPVIQEEINKRLRQFGIDPLEIEPDASTRTSFGSTNFRYAVSIGFRF